MQSNVFAAWTRQIQRHAVAVLALIGVVTGVAFWYTANNLAIKTSTADMIDAKTPFRTNAIAFDAAFPQFNDLIVLVIDAPSAAAARTAARSLASELQQRPHLFIRAEAPQLDPYFQRNGLLFLDIAELDALADRLARGAPFLAALADRPNLAGLFGIVGRMLSGDDANVDPADAARLLDKISDIAQAQADRQPGDFAWRALFDPETQRGRRQIVIAQPRLDGGGFAPASQALSEIRRIAGELSGVTIRLTGSAALAHEELQSVEVGGKTAGWLSLTLVIVLLIAGLRSARLILPTLVTLVAGLIWTATFAALAIGHLNLISVAFAVLFIGLGVDFSIHYCLRWREYAGQEAALPRTADAVGRSLAIGALCAAIGFASFLPTDYKGLGELGLISSGGMAIAFFMNMTLLPAMLALFGGTGSGNSGGAARTPAPARDPFAQRFHRPILAVAACVGVLAAAALPFAQFDFSPMNLKDPASESVAAFNDLAREPGSGVYVIDVLATDEADAARIAARLATLPEVGRVVTLESFVPNNQAEKLAVIEDMSFFLSAVLSASPADSAPPPLATLREFRKSLADLAAGHQDQTLRQSTQRLALLLDTLNDAANAQGLEQRLTTGLPSLLSDLRLLLSVQPVTREDIPQRLRRSWIAEDGRIRVQAWPAKAITGNNDLRRFAAAVLAVAPRAVGTPVTITQAGGAVVAAFRQATATAFVLVAIVLLVLLRRFSDTMLVLAPLVLAAMLTGATSVILDLPFNFANVIVLPLLFGLGVASGVHLVLRRRRTGNAAELLHTSTPRAVLYSALTTIASFGSLALSGHRGMTSMGQLLTIAIAYTLICTLIVLPALMVWRERRAQQ
jgi:hopanoid biosynthesis associated RND transporter like protein HpnN